MVKDNRSFNKSEEEKKMLESLNDLPPEKKEFEEDQEEKEEKKVEAPKEEEKKEDVKEEVEEEKKKVEAPKEEEEKPKEDIKKRYADSSREGIILNGQVKSLRNVIKNAAAIPEPTEEQMIKEYGDDWDTMSDVEKKTARKAVKADLVNAALTQANQEFEDLESWNGKVDEFVDSPKTLLDNPLLEGKQEEFKTFASKPTRRGASFDLLVSAFLHETATTRVKNKGSMFEKGSGGPNDKVKPKSEKLTIEDSRTLRKTNYKLWREYVQAGKIDLNVD